MTNEDFDPLSPEVGVALSFILKNWNPTVERLQEFLERSIEKKEQNLNKKDKV